MQQLTLIRHGVTEWNASGRFQGQTDIPLSEEGRLQAQVLAKHLKKVKVERVFSSTLMRAVETAHIVFPQTEVMQDARLNELNFGCFEGRTLAENQGMPEYNWWLEDTFKRPAPEGESYELLRNRVVDWLKSLPQDQHIVAFTHSGTIQMLLSHVLGVEHPKWRKRVYLRHTGITRVLFKDDEAIIERVNDTRHLVKNADLDPFSD